MHQWFLSFKMCIFNSLDSSCLQNAWFWRVMFKILCIYPLYQCLCNSEKDQAGPGIQSSKWAHLPVLPGYWSVDWFLRFIEMHTLPRSQGTSMTATLRGGSFLSQRLLAIQEFFLKHTSTLKGKLYAMHWRSFKQDLFRDQKKNVYSANDNPIQSCLSPALKNSKNHNLRRAIKITQCVK